MTVISRNVATFKDEQQRIEFTNLLRSRKKTYRPTKTLEKTYVDKIARGMWVESRVGHAIDELLLEPHSQEAPLRKFLEQSNLPEVAVPGLRSANGITNWSPGAVVLRMSTSEDENSTSRLMRYKKVLRRDLREAIKDLENLQKSRRISENDEPTAKTEPT